MAIPSPDLQSVPLLRTKLYIPPPRHEQVLRPRLLERLDAGLEKKLTLLSAPAGFGKTTLVSEWIWSKQYGGHAAAGDRADHETLSSLAPYSHRRQVGLPTPHFAWLSLDESDNDPTRFLTYLIAALQAALQSIEPEIGKGALAALATPQPPPVEAVLTALINDIAARSAAHASSARIVLVLDDYHLIQDTRPESAAVHDALTFLLEHLPPPPSSGGLHLVITTREDPPLPLARLRARGQLTELRGADLRFTRSEAAEFLNQRMGLELGEHDVAALEARTEGWIAGLQLAALSLQGRENADGLIQSFTGSHRFVLDYLIEEVLAQQPESVQAFLLQTAVLDRLTGPLCEALTGQEESRQTLERLERANLFIVPLDDERRWYRYHRLFSDLLVQRLRQAQPEQVAALHSRASRWYERNGYLDEAIEHAMRAEQYERAAALIDQDADAIWMRAEHAKLGRWLNALPREVLGSKPHLCIYAAWMLFALGQRDPAKECLLSAEQALGLPGPTDTKLRGRLAAIRALMVSWWGDAPAIIGHARHALKDLPVRDPWRGPAAIALGDAYELQDELEAAYQARMEAAEACKAAGDSVFHLIAGFKVASTLQALGRLQESVEICQQQIEFAGEHGLAQSSLAGSLWAQWSAVLAEWNDLDGALERARKGVALTENGDLALRGFAKLCLVSAFSARGELSAAGEILEELETLAREHDLPLYTTHPAAIWRVILWLMQGDVAAAARWAAERGLDAEAEPPLKPEDEYALLARILYAQERLDPAARLLQHLLEAAEAGERLSSLIGVLALQAQVFQAQGKPAQAMAALERALALAEPAGFVRIFVGEGPPMARLLYDALGRGILPDYVGKLLAAFPDLEAQPVGKPQIPKSEISKSQILEPMSERETEVLQLIAEGLTNPEIGDRLYISLNTVKVHTRNIYGKLDAHSRTQAVARARTLGILPSS